MKNLLIVQICILFSMLSCVSNDIQNPKDGLLHRVIEHFKVGSNDKKDKERVYDAEDELVLQYYFVYKEVEEAITTAIACQSDFSKTGQYIPVCHKDFVVDSVINVSDETIDETIAAEFWKLYTDKYGMDIPSKARDSNTGKLYTINELLEIYPDSVRTEFDDKLWHRARVQGIDMSDMLRAYELCKWKSLPKLIYYRGSKPKYLPTSVQYTQWIYSDKTEDFTREITLCDNFAIVTEIEGETKKSYRACCSVYDKHINVSHSKFSQVEYNYCTYSYSFTLTKENSKYVLIDDDDKTHYYRYKFAGKVNKTDFEKYRYPLP